MAKDITVVWPKSLSKKVADDYLEFRKSSGYEMNPNFIHTIFRTCEAMAKLNLQNRITVDTYEKTLSLLRSNNPYF